MKSLDKKKTKVDYSKPVEPIMTADNVIVGYKNVQNKPKELEWDRFVKENHTNFSKDANGIKYEFYEDDLLEFITQQRTELLEEINNLEYGGYIQVMASKKNWDERNGYDKAKEDITNLLNKKDE